MKIRILNLIAKNTAKEILRDRILYGLFIIAVLMILISLMLGNLSFAEHARIVTNLGLVAGQLGCALIAIFIGSSLVWKEIERQTVLTLLSKPVSRTEFIVGKYLGLGSVIVLVNVLIGLFVALICSQYGKLHLASFIGAQIGNLFESLTLLSLAVFFGSFCRPTLTTIFTLSLWLVGHGLNDLGYFASKSSSVMSQTAGKIVSRILPNLEFFNLREAAVYGDSLAFSQIQSMCLYFGIWVVFLLTLTTWIFQKRDFV